MKKALLLITIIATVASIGTIVSRRYERATDVATQGSRISANGTPIPTPVGDETQGNALKIGFFTPPPTYLHIVHDMGYYHFDYGIDAYKPDSGRAQKDYDWIAKAFNTAVIGYPNQGTDDTPTKSSFKAAVDHNVWIVVAGGDFAYIAQKISQSPYKDHVIGFRIYDEFVPPVCESRRTSGSPCSVSEYVSEGQQILKAVAQKIHQYSFVPIMLDFIPVELTYSADNPAQWATDRPGNSNAALTGYLKSCAIDQLFLALEGDDSSKGGKTIAQKVEEAKKLWSSITCTDGTKKTIRVGLRNGGGGFDTEHFSQTGNGAEIIRLVEEAAIGAVKGGADSVDLYPWRHITGSIDRKTLDLVPCPGSTDPNCRTGATNAYYASLVTTYQKIQEMQHDGQPTPEPKSIIPKTIKCLLSTCESTP